MNDQLVRIAQRPELSHDDISSKAREIWQNYGSPVGRDEEIWLEAESQLKNRNGRVPKSEDVQPSSQRDAEIPSEASIEAARKIPSKEAELMGKNSSTLSGRPKSRPTKNR